MAEDFSNKTLMGIILILIIGVVLFLFITKAKNESWDATEKDLCKKSVQFQAQQKAFLTVKGTHLTDIYGNKVDLKCYTQYLEIKSKEDEVIKRDIATSMYHCWDQFGRGELEIFDTTDNNYCVVCSRLEFPKKDKIVGLTDFLMTERALASSDQTYFQFLNGVKVEDNQVLESYENSNIANLDELDLTNPLAVTFVMGKNAYPDASIGAEHGKLDTIIPDTAIAAVGATVIGLLLCGTGVGCIITMGVATVAGGSVGYFVGSDTAAAWDAQVMLWDYNDIGNLNCEYLEGQSTPLKPIDMNKYK